MIEFVAKITPITWFAIFSIILTLVSLIFKFDRKVIFYFAKRNKPWAVRASTRLYNELLQKQAKNKTDNLKRAMKLADEMSEGLNGKRLYVIERNNAYMIFSRMDYFRWLKNNGKKGTYSMLIRDAVYFTKNKVR